MLAIDCTFINAYVIKIYPAPNNSQDMATHADRAPQYINSLAPVRGGCNFENITFKFFPWIDTPSACSKSVVMRMQQNSISDKSTLVKAHKPLPEPMLTQISAAIRH